MCNLDFDFTVEGLGLIGFILEQYTCRDQQLQKICDRQFGGAFVLHRPQPSNPYSYSSFKCKLQVVTR